MRLLSTAHLPIILMGQEFSTKLGKIQVSNSVLFIPERPIAYCKKIFVIFMGGTTVDYLKHPNKKWTGPILDIEPIHAISIFSRQCFYAMFSHIFSNHSPQYCKAILCP